MRIKKLKAIITISRIRIPNMAPMLIPTVSPVESPLFGSGVGTVDKKDPLGVRLEEGVASMVLVRLFEALGIGMLVDGDNWRLDSVLVIPLSVGFGEEDAILSSIVEDGKRFEVEVNYIKWYTYLCCCN